MLCTYRCASAWSRLSPRTAPLLTYMYCHQTQPETTLLSAQSAKAHLKRDPIQADAWHAPPPCPLLYTAPKTASMPPHDFDIPSPSHNRSLPRATCHWSTATCSPLHCGYCRRARYCYAFRCCCAQRRTGRCPTLPPSAPPQALHQGHSNQTAFSAGRGGKAGGGGGGACSACGGACISGCSCCCCCSTCHRSGA